MRAIFRSVSFCFGIAVATAGSVAHGQQTSLWMADETNGHLWAFTDYENPSSNTYDWGEMQWFNGTSWQAFGGGTEKELEGMAVTASGFAYFSVNQALGSTSSPVLMSVDLATITLGSPIQMQTIGSIRNSGGTPYSQFVEALAYHGSTGQLYGLAGSTSSAIDHLFQIDKNTGIYTDLGEVSGLGQSLTYFDGLEFMGDNLYAYDNGDNHLYQINYSGSGALISAVIDNNVDGGLGATDIEGLIYDPNSGRLLAIDNSSQHAFHDITLDNGNNSTISSFTGGGSPVPANADFEGGAFFVRIIPAPEPSGALLTCCSGLLLLRRKRKILIPFASNKTAREFPPGLLCA